MTQLHFAVKAQFKICGLTSLADAQAAAGAGAAALGFNFYPKSVRYLSPASVRPILSELPDNLLNAGVFVNETRETIAAILEQTGLNALQLHGDEPPELFSYWPGKSVIVAVRLGAPGWEQRLEAAADRAHYVLLDSYVADSMGGSGVQAPMELLKHPSVAAVRNRAFLAGGLNPLNVAQKIELFKPFGVDVASGVESEPGKKSLELLAAFAAAVQSASY